MKDDNTYACTPKTFVVGAVSCIGEWFGNRWRALKNGDEEEMMAAWISSTVIVCGSIFTWWDWDPLRVDPIRTIVTFVFMGAVGSLLLSVVAAFGFILWERVAIWIELACMRGADVCRKNNTKKTT